MPVHGKARHLQLVQAIAQGHALKASFLPEHAAKTLGVLRRYVDDVGELGQQLVHVVDILGNDFEREGRSVLRQRDTVAIVDEPARRRERHNLDAVVLGQRAEMLVLDHLQLHHAQHQNSREQQNTDAGGHHTTAHDACLAGNILDGVNRLHGQSD